MGPVPGSETQISRKKSLNFLTGIWISLGIWANEYIYPIASHSLTVTVGFRMLFVAAPVAATEIAFSFDSAN